MRRWPRKTTPCVGFLGLLSENTTSWAAWTATEVYPLPVLEARHPESGCWPGWLLLGIVLEATPGPSPGSRGSETAFALLGLQTLLSLHLHTRSPLWGLSLCRNVPSPSCEERCAWFPPYSGVTPPQPTTGSRTLFPSKVAFGATYAFGWGRHISPQTGSTCMKWPQWANPWISACLGPRRLLGNGRVAAGGQGFSLA